MEDMIIIVSLVSCAIVYFLFHMVIKRSSSKVHLPPLPPGPYPWPIIGNFFQIRKDTHVCLAEMAQVHGPLMSLRLGQKLIIVGSSPTVASEFLKTHDKALSGRDVARLLMQDKGQAGHNKNLVFTSNCDDGWRYIRNIYRSELFSSKALESRTKMRETKVMEMVKYLGLKEGEDINIKDVTFVTAMNILSNALLSIDLVDFEGNGIGAGVMNSIRGLAMLAKPQLADMYPIFSRLDLHGWYNQVMHIIRELGDVWKDSLEKKRNGSNISSSLKDFSDTLIEKGFNNHQISILIQELFSAGTESTSSTIEWFVVELLKNEEVMHRVIDEVVKQIDGNIVQESDLEHLPFLEACFKETLRLHPPAPLLLPHRAIQTCEVMGYTIPKDSQILVNVWAINRDPKIWDDPLIFKPDRFIGSKLSYKGKDFEYIPFGSGRRMCPGEAMGSKTIPLIIASLIRNFDVFLPNHMNVKEINMDEALDFVMHKKETLHVILKLREQFKN